jgi:hypothetical protein
MKLESFSISILAAAVVIMGLLAAPLQASQYLGEVTWDYSGGGTVKAGISKEGGSYYEVQGQVFTPNGTIIFSGGGAVVDGIMKISAAATMVETNSGGTYHNANTIQINIDPVSSAFCGW